MPDIHTAYTDRYELLKDFARKNRNNPTEAERCLWQQLRTNGLGVRFRRQHIIGDYIGDFVCVEKKLIIEVDGPYHFTEEQTQEDEIRSRNLQSMGYRIVRFTNDEIFGNIDSVINKIKQTL